MTVLVETTLPAVLRILLLSLVVWSTGCGQSPESAKNPSTGVQAIDATPTAPAVTTRLATPSQVPVDGLSLNALFATDRVLEVEIQVAPKDWDTIRHQSRNFVEALQAKRREGPIDHPYTYVTAKVTIDGVTFENVGLRKKGFMGSQNTQRPSLKIKLNHEGAERSVAGLTTLTFNNDQQDTGHISRLLA